MKFKVPHLLIFLAPLTALAGEGNRLPPGLLDSCGRRPANAEKLETHYKAGKSVVSACVESQRKAIKACNEEPEGDPEAGSESKETPSGAHQAAVKTKEAAAKARDAHIGRTDVCEKAKVEADEACEKNHEEVVEKFRKASSDYEALQKEFLSRQSQGSFDPDLHKRLLEAQGVKRDLDESRKLIRNSKRVFGAGVSDGKACQVAQAHIYHDAVTQADLVAASASASGTPSAQGASAPVEGDPAPPEQSQSQSQSVMDQMTSSVTNLKVNTLPLNATIAAGKGAAQFIAKNPLAVTGVGTFVSAVTYSSPTSTCDTVFSGPVDAYKGGCQFFFSQSMTSANINESAIKILESP